MKTFRINQQEDQRDVNGRKVSYFEAEKREKIYQRHCVNTGCRRWNNLEWSEKERNPWRTEEQTPNESAKEKNNS